MKLELEMAGKLSPVLLPDEPSDNVLEMMRNARLNVEALAIESDQTRRAYDGALIRKVRQDGRVDINAFGRQYFRRWKDAGRRMGAAVAEYERLKQRARANDLLELDDMSSQFGSISGDGRTGSAGTDYRRFRAQKRAINRRRIEQYRMRTLLAGSSRRAFSKPSTPSTVWIGPTADSGWSEAISARPEMKGDLRRIEAVKRQSAWLRKDNNYGRANTGYGGGGLELDRQYGFVKAAVDRQIVRLSVHQDTEPDVPDDASSEANSFRWCC